MNPSVKHVYSLDGYRLELLFEDGERRVFDVKPYLHCGDFVRLQEPATFRSSGDCRFGGVARRAGFEL